MRTTIILLASLLLFSCSSSVDNTNKNTNYEAFFTKFFGNFNKHDWGAMASMYTATADFKDPALGVGVHKRTRAQTIAHYTQLSQMIPDVKDSVIQIYPSKDNTVIVEFVSTGTAPNGEKFTLPLCAIMTIENGLITKDYVYYDNF